jgi:hypothetical protein
MAEEGRQRGTPLAYPHQRLTRPSPPPFLPCAPQEKGVQLLLPTDVVVADKFDANANTQTVPVTAIPDGWMGLDIGPDSVKAFNVRWLFKCTGVRYRIHFSEQSMCAEPHGTRPVGFSASQPCRHCRCPPQPPAPPLISPTLRPPWPTPRPWSGTAPWASSSSPSSPTAPWCVGVACRGRAAGARQLKGPRAHGAHAVGRRTDSCSARCAARSRRVRALRAEADRCVSALLSLSPARSPSPTPWRSSRPRAASPLSVAVTPWRPWSRCGPCVWRVVHALTRACFCCSRCLGLAAKASCPAPAELCAPAVAKPCSLPASPCPSHSGRRGGEDVAHLHRRRCLAGAAGGQGPARRGCAQRQVNVSLARTAVGGESLSEGASRWAARPPRWRATLRCGARLGLTVARP